MANSEQLSILFKGVDTWNKWRRKVPRNKKVEIDLSGADLSGMDLAGGNFMGVDFSGACLDGAGLSDACFSLATLDRVSLKNVKAFGASFSEAGLFEANLTHAYCDHTTFDMAVLKRANLNQAFLFGCSFDCADLSFANLMSADLRNSNFAGANLSKACITGAVLSNTAFIDNDLSTLKGLDSCRFNGPCAIDHRTLKKSYPLPLSFLKGCGLPDEYIDYIPSIFGNDAIEFYQCFISYSSCDADFAKRLHSDLQNEGVRCWFDRHDMKIGDRLRSTIDEAIRVKDKLLLILSESSLRSNWVEKEVETAFEEESRTGKTILFPIRIDDSVMDTDCAWASDIRRTRHIGDFRNWKSYDGYGRSFDRLMRDLKNPEPVKRESVA